MNQSDYQVATYVHSCRPCFLYQKQSHHVCNPCTPKLSVMSFFSVGAASGTFMGVGVGVGVFLLLSVLTLVAIILVVVVKRRKVTYKQKGESKMEDNPCYNNALVAKQGNEVEEKGLCADYAYADMNEATGSIVDGFDPYADVDNKAQIKTARKQAPKESSTPVSVTNSGDLYAVVDKSQKKGSEKEKETVTNKEGLYTMPMKKKGKLTERGEGVVESGGVERGEEYDNVVSSMSQRQTVSLHSRLKETARI